jgi:hypothetical protein
MDESPSRMTIAAKFAVTVPALFSLAVVMEDVGLVMAIVPVEPHEEKT